ncbi:MAG TPA: hypothetical protein VFH54_01905 [Mycobacteriales bacterium]|nr:hypothetical protein [Mycobacteriales bacterium]
MANALKSASAHVAPPPRARSPRRRSWRRHRLIAAGAAAVAVAGGLAGLLLSRGGGPGPIPVPHYAVPAAYQISYVVTTPHGQPSTERVSVRRPFESVDEFRNGAPPGTTTYLTIVNRLGAQVLESGTAQATELQVPAAAAPQDMRPDVIVAAGLRSHALKYVGAETILGRRCQVFRSAAPLRSGPVQPVSSPSTYTDTCIDGQGLVLREKTVQRGILVSERRAVDVAIGPSAVADAPFALTGTHTPVDSGGGAFTALTFASRPPGGSWALVAPPIGFQWVGRYAVIPPQPSDAGASAFSVGPPPGQVSELDDVFVRGVDVIVVQQGSTLNGASFAPPNNAQPVALGALGAGQLQVGGSVSTITAEPYGGRRFLRLSGTLPPDELLAIARSLTLQAGGTLTRLHGKGAS